MSFIPFVAELAAEAGAVVTEATGYNVLGAIASSAIVKGSEKIAEEASRTFVDEIFGTGTFDNLENHILELYSDTYNAANTINEFKTSMESGNKTSQQQISNLINTGKKLDNSHIIKGTSNFVKDFSYLVSQGSYNSLDSSQAVIENNQSTIQKVINTLSKVNPFYSYLASKFVGKLSDFVIPTDEEYLKVAEVYNAQGLYSRNMFIEKFDSNYDFCLFDETGAKQVWKYPEYNNYVVVPPIFGVWTGINSPNNSLCLTGESNSKIIESFLDKIAFLHDVGYHDKGSFNKFSDYQLISRAKYGKENNLFIFPGELATANIAIAYFSTLGILMRKMTGEDSIINSELIPVPLIEKELITTVKNSIPLQGSGDITNNFLLIDEINNLEIQLN